MRRVTELIHLIQYSNKQVTEYDPAKGETIEAPIYVATPKTFGSKPLTIEEYQRRNKKQLKPIKPPPKKKSRGGRLNWINKTKYLLN